MLLLTQHTALPVGLLPSLCRRPLIKPSLDLAGAGSENRVSRLPACRVRLHENSQSESRCSSAGSADNKLSRAVQTTTLLGALAPLPSWAEQHSGIFALADLNAETAGKIALVLGPILSLSIFLMICRIPLSWYPNLNIKKLPWVIAVAPTEPVLGPTRKAVPPVGGVDVAPIIWVAALSFVNEILLGPQGILNLLQRKVDL